jgi:YesN/AraC family two-component response regulator
MSGFVAKATFDKTASELAAAKKTIREKMTEDEAKKALEAEERAALLERVEKAEHALAVSGYEKAYLAMGYDEKLAKSTAEALAKGDMDAVFKNQKIHAEVREKALRTELLKNTPPPAAGNNNTGMTKEQFSKLTLAEKNEFATKNPDVYKEFYGG